MAFTKWTMLTQLYIDIGIWDNDMISLTDDCLSYKERLRKARVMERDLADLVQLHHRFQDDFPDGSDYPHADILEGIYCHQDDMVEIMPMLRAGKKQEDIEERRRARAIEEARLAALADDDTIASRVVQWRTPSSRSVRPRVEVDVDMLEQSLAESLGNFHGEPYYTLAQLQSLLQV